jgi:hypothetical protein
VDLNGLENLTTVGGLDFRRNPVLVDVDAFSSVTQLNGTEEWVCFGSNPVLGDLDGLDNIVDMAGIAICIVDNLSLPNCEAIGFRDRMIAGGWSGYSCIKGNLPDGCPDDISGCPQCEDCN